MSRPGYFIVAAIASTLAACAGSVSVPAIHGVATPSVVLDAASKVRLTPSKAAFAQGTTFPMRVGEKNYKGTFTSVSKGAKACKDIASWSPVKGKGPNYVVKIKGITPGACSIIFSDAHKNKATLSVTVRPVPLDYIYSVNYGSNDVAQDVFESDGSLKEIAPNYPLSATCTGPNSIALDTAGDLLFVACYGTGNVVTLSVSAKDHTVGASQIAPAPVPSALALVVPSSGAPNTLYVDASGQTNGAIAAFKYSATALTPIATYMTPGSYPDEMAFNTNSSGASTLYVASGYDPETCTNNASSGAVEQWLQGSTGSLTAQTSIPVCGIFYNLVLSSGNLYWAGPSLWGGYSLATSTPLTLPAPPWAAYGGPSYDPDSMNVVTPGNPPPAIARGRLPRSPYAQQYIISAGDGNLYISLPGGPAFTSVRMATGATSTGAVCNSFSSAIFIKPGELVTELCWYFANDDLYVIERSTTGAFTQLWKIPIGNSPAGMTVRGQVQ